MISLKLAYWAGLIIYSLLSASYVGNNVATTAALTLGTGVAEWRLIMILAILGFTVGGSAYFFSSFHSLLGEVALNLTSDMITLLISLFLWISMAMFVGIFFQVPLAGPLMSLVGLLTGLLISGYKLDSYEDFLILLSIEFLVILFSTSISFFVKGILARVIENDPVDPLAKSLKLLPILFILVIPTHVGFYVYGILSKLDNFLVQLCVAGGSWGATLIITWLFAKMFLVNFTKRHVFAIRPPQVIEYENKRLTGDNLAERGLVVGRVTPTSTSQKTTASDVILNKARAEESMAFLLLALTCGSAVVQGYIDVGFLTSLWRLLQIAIVGAPDTVPLTGLDSSYSFIPTVILGFIGIFLFGRRACNLIANELFIDGVNPIFAVSIQLGCLLPTALAAYNGIPISPILSQLTCLLLLGYLNDRAMRKSQVFRFIGILFSSILGVVIFTALTAFITRPFLSKTTP